jgi:hypothetical protein
MEEKIILDTTDESAKFVTNISGWVSRLGNFYGNDERLARWNGCTHTTCECGKIIERDRIKCFNCRKKASDEKFQSLHKQEWDEKTPITLFDGDEYFFDRESLENYCEEYKLNINELQLVLCKPIYVSELDPNDIYCDDLSEDTYIEDIDSGLAEKFRELNKYIKDNKIIISWYPTDIAAIVKKKKN